MVGEAGETANVVKKIRRIDTGGRGREAEADRAVMVSKMGDEVADTIIYADLLMAKEHLSLWPHIVRKFNRTSEEYGFPQRLLPVQDGE
jgi:NTP pyrophosphatase (non-canonical NTP hydrolase)